MPSRMIRTLAVAVPLLAYLSTSRFARNIPFHLNPPDFPASLAGIAWSASERACLEEFTVHGSSKLSASERLAFCEDAIPFASDGEDLVLLSCDPNRRSWNTVMGPLADPYGAHGALWVLNPASHEGREPEVQKVELEWPAFAAGEAQFHPLGIEVVEAKEHKSASTLLVVNHGASESTIEVFSLSSSPSSPSFRIVHAHTLRHSSFTGAPNSIAILPDSSTTALRFFLSHDHRFNRRTTSPFLKLANFVETVGAMALSRVDYVEVNLPETAAGEPQIKVETVVPGVAFANGLALSPSGKTLIVASTTRRELRFYRVAPSASSAFSPSLTLIRVAHVPFLVDNLSILPSPSSPPSSDSEAFTVLAAGHPSYPALLSAAHKLHLSLHLPSFLSRFFSWPGFDFDWERQSGMSWAAAVQHPRSASKMAGEPDWMTVFASHGRREEGGFGGSTTAVGGVFGKDGKKCWLVVPGLYEEGVKVIRQAE